MKRNYRWLEAIPYLAALVSCAPLIFGGFPQGHDWAFELARVAEYSHALGEGQFPPHWAPNLYGGYGSPAPSVTPNRGDPLRLGAGLWLVLVVVHRRQRGAAREVSICPEH